MTAKTEYVAVNSVAAQGAGAIVWWKINGSTMCAALEAEWAQRVDLDPELLMNRPTAGAALRRALASQAHACDGGRILVSSLGEDNAYAVTREITKRDGFEGEPQYTTLLKVRLAENATVQVGDKDYPQLDAVVLAAGAHVILNEVRSDYEKNLLTFSGTEISQWFSMVLLPAFHAVSLRDQGGMWFVPRTYLDLWYQAADAVRQVSGHQVFAIPALDTSADAIAGILDALAAEAEKEAQAMEDKILNENLGVRALKNQVAKLDRVAGKVTQYEQMLGANLETLRERLSALNAQMAAAIFTAEAAKDAAEGEAA